MIGESEYSQKLWLPDLQKHYSIEQIATTQTKALFCQFEMSDWDIDGRNQGVDLEEYHFEDREK